MSLHSFPRVAKRTPIVRHPAIQNNGAGEEGTCVAVGVGLSVIFCKVGTGVFGILVSVIETMRTVSGMDVRFTWKMSCFSSFTPIRDVLNTDIV
jgi:hypothetical protein